ncbi:MAG: HAD-IA family hydrolase [Myxococcales bacterium]|nr:HAD-IA family hydrolase [Myxococcales bacterium]
MNAPPLRPLRALLLDAAGTLLHPAEPVAAVYARTAREFGGSREPPEIASRMRAAMADPSLRAGRRREPSWREFWREVVARSTGVEDPRLLTALYDHFATPAAWELAAGAQSCCAGARARGLRVAVVSNWDTRLRPLLEALGVMDWIDLALISGELGVEKPDAEIFARACAALGVTPAEALHVGDSRGADVEGARAAGCRALRFGGELRSFAELSARLARETP